MNINRSEASNSLQRLKSGQTRKVWPIANLKFSTAGNFGTRGDVFRFVVSSFFFFYPCSYFLSWLSLLHKFSISSEILLTICMRLKLPILFCSRFILFRKILATLLILYFFFETSDFIFLLQTWLFTISPRKWLHFMFGFFALWPPEVQSISSFQLCSSANHFSFYCILCVVFSWLWC